VPREGLALCGESTMKIDPHKTSRTPTRSAPRLSPLFVAEMARAPDLLAPTVTFSGALENGPRAAALALLGGDCARRSRGLRAVRRSRSTRGAVARVEAHALGSAERGRSAVSREYARASGSQLCLAIGRATCAQ